MVSSIRTENPHSLPVKELFVRSGDESKNREKGRGKHTNARLEQRVKFLGRAIPKGDDWILHFQSHKDCSFELSSYFLCMNDFVYTSVGRQIDIRPCPWCKMSCVCACVSIAVELVHISVLTNHISASFLFTLQWKDLSSNAKREIRFFSI